MKYSLSKINVYFSIINLTIVYISTILIYKIIIKGYIMQKLRKNTTVFVATYFVFMLLTYILPYFGSNSLLVNSLVAGATGGVSPAFFVHLMCLLILIGITFMRTKDTQSKWIVIFPVLATIFDLVPLLSAIPLVPTVLHILTIVLCVKIASQIK